MTDEERFTKIRELLTEAELEAVLNLIVATDEAADHYESHGLEVQANRFNDSVAIAINIIGRNPMLEAQEEIAKRFLCVDCTTCTSTTDEYYMVCDEVWTEEAHMEPEGGMLCIGCLESRLMRRLTHVDFTDAPINFMSEQSPRLKDRLKGKAHPLKVAA